MTCADARTEPSNGYFDPEDQPASMTPYTAMPDMARTSRIPMGGSATCNSKVWLPMVITPPTGTTVKTSTAGITARYGASLNTKESAPSGSRSSLKMSLVPSANVCSRPHGPARFGPTRLCMSEITLRSNQIISAVATSSATKATTHLMMTMSQTSQLRPKAKSGSPLPLLALWVSTWDPRDPAEPAVERMA